MPTARSIWFFIATSTAVECSAALPTMATTTTPMKIWFIPSTWLACSTAPTRISLITGHEERRDDQDGRRRAAAPVFLLVVEVVVVGIEQALVGDQAEHQMGQVGEHQDHRDADAQLMLEESTVAAR